MTKQNNKLPIEYMILGLIIGLLLGMLLGGVMQQMIIRASLIDAAESFNGDINVNFNETKFVEETHDMFVPVLTSIFNSTVVREFGGCQKIKQDNGLYLLNCTNIKNENK